MKMESQYDQFYKRITEPLRGHVQGMKVITVIDKVITYSMYVAYPIMLFHLFLKKDHRVFRTVLIPGISFVLVTIVRKRWNRKRPYETWKIKPLIIKDKKGQSMPSRHVFSSTVISMAFLFLYPPLGIVCMIISIVEAIIRVLGGVHYPSDVIAGFLIGVGAGLIFFII